MAEGPTVSRWQRVASLAKTLFWLVLIVVVLQQVYGSNRLETARSSVLDRFQQQRKSRVIALINRQETVTLFGVPVSSSISIEDSEAVLRAIRLTPEDQPIDVILHTPGGLVLAAEQISKADRKSTRLNSSHTDRSRLPSSAWRKRQNSARGSGVPGGGVRLGTSGL